ncbi:flagellin [Halolactibacillus halophilus]|uniref:Flagellin n=1 Tax=Halolactibacillus halophilus TaxID=306540 RepID=A0A1I5QB51_9BACI|nr:flagellin [Halolactibacillus halophilus]GEM01715.1 flagellin [Halolactibacillus halophilus]SFP43241.1 flagellin [Halolactibacillus halophilus]
MIINNNIPALNTYRQLGINQNSMQKSMEKLSSGLRINKAGDDAAGLAISEKMRGQIRGLDQASRNASDGISLIQTAEGALDETHNILQRMRELSVQSSNDTNTASDRAEIQKEIDQLTDEIDRIANTTEFNTQKLLDGSKAGLQDEINGKVNVENNSSISNLTAAAADAKALDKTGTIIITRTDSADGDQNDFEIGDPNSTGVSLTDTTTLTGFGSDLTLSDLTGMKVGESITISVSKYEAAQTDASKSLTAQIGANSGQTIDIGIDNMNASNLGVRNGDSSSINIESAEKATAAITTINNAIEKVSSQRSNLGSVQNRLEHTISNLDNSSENLSAAESRIRDVDMAEEMMEMTRANILSQASQSMLAQANSAPQSVLQLLG